MDERISCLEFYCRLAPGAKPSFHTNELGQTVRSQQSLFGIAEDHRRRLHIQLLKDENIDENNENANSESKNTANSLSAIQQWRCTYALRAEASTRNLFDTMGTCALDWLLDGFSCLILGMGPSRGGKTFSILGDSSVAPLNASLMGDKSVVMGVNSSILGAGPESSERADSKDSRSDSKNLAKKKQKMSNGFGILALFLHELYLKKKPDHKVGISFWNVRGYEVRDQRGEVVGGENTTNLNDEGAENKDGGEQENLLPSPENSPNGAHKTLNSENIGNHHFDAVDCAKLEDALDIIAELRSAAERNDDKRIVGKNPNDSTQRHLFVRVALVQPGNESNNYKTTVASAHFVDLANSRDDIECAADIRALHSFFDESSLVADAGGLLDTKNSPATGGQNNAALNTSVNQNISMLASPITPGNNNVSSSRINPLASPFSQITGLTGLNINGNSTNLAKTPATPTLELANYEDQGPRPLISLLGPLIAGNCKTFLLVGLPEANLSRSDLNEAKAILDCAERASLIVTTCEKTCLNNGEKVELISDMGEFFCPTQKRYDNVVLGVEDVQLDAHGPLTNDNINSPSPRGSVIDNQQIAANGLNDELSNTNRNVTPTSASQRATSSNRGLSNTGSKRDNNGILSPAQLSAGLLSNRGTPSVSRHSQIGGHKRQESGATERSTATTTNLMRKASDSATSVFSTRTGGLLRENTNTANVENLNTLQSTAGTASHSVGGLKIQRNQSAASVFSNNSRKNTENAQNYSKDQSTALVNTHNFMSSTLQSTGSFSLNLAASPDEIVTRGKGLNQVDSPNTSPSKKYYMNTNDLLQSPNSASGANFGLNSSNSQGNINFNKLKERYEVLLAAHKRTVSQVEELKSNNLLLSADYENLLKSNDRLSDDLDLFKSGKVPSNETVLYVH